MGRDSLERISPRALKNEALSYWFATESRDALPNHHLAGDRNVKGSGGGSCGTGGITSTKIVNLHPQGANSIWTEELHVKAGNLSVVDGSVHQLSFAALTVFLEHTGDSNLSNCILLP